MRSDNAASEWAIMSNVIRSKKQATPVAVNVTGQLEPVEPDYWPHTASSAVARNLQIPSEPTEWQAPVVMRGNRMVGIRHLYARGAVRQPISPLGTGPDIGQSVWVSEFQPDLMGPIHNAGFNDALFQAGYPGFNLGLSFKVQTLQQNATGGPGYNMYMTSRNKQNMVQQIRSAKGFFSARG